MLGFPKAIYQYRYDLQAGWYTHVLGRRDVKFYFLVIDTEYNNPPVLYYATPAFLDKARTGYYVHWRYYKGWEQLLSELIEHNELQQYEYPMDIYKNNGVVSFDL